MSPQHHHKTEAEENREELEKLEGELHMPTASEVSNFASKVSAPSSPTPTSTTTRKEDRTNSLKAFHKAQISKEEEKAHQMEQRRLMPFFERKWLDIKDWLIEYFELGHKSDVDDCFLFSRPSLYFFLVEFGLLLQCFFIAVYLTQLLAMGQMESSPNSSGWIAGLTIPTFSNFFLIRIILSRAVTLKAVTDLHKEVVCRVCEEAVEAEEIQDKVRLKVYEVLDPNLQSSALLSSVKLRFDSIDVDGSGEIDKKEFRTFLGTLSVNLSKEKFDILWSVVDYDLSGAVTCDEIVIFIFPNLKRSMRGNLDIIKRIKHHFINALSKSPKSQWESELQIAFEKIDKDGSGEVDAEEFKGFLDNFGISIGERQLSLLWSTLDLDGSGSVSFDEFKEVFLDKDMLEIGGGGGTRSPGPKASSTAHLHVDTTTTTTNPTPAKPAVETDSLLPSNSSSEIVGSDSRNDIQMLTLTNADLPPTPPPTQK